MNPPPASPIASAARLQAVRRTGLVDAPTTAPALDRIARLAARIVGAPCGIVTLVDLERQVFPGCYGMPDLVANGRETPITQSICRTVVDEGRLLAIPDTGAEERWRDHPGVRAYGIVAYLGTPLVNAAGETLGAVCVMDGVPHAWTDADREALHDLAAQVTSELELREEIAARHRAATALRDSEERLRLVQQATNDVVWDYDVRTGVLAWSDAVQTVLRYAPDQPDGTLGWWESRVHPEDHARVVDPFHARFGLREAEQSRDRPAAGDDSHWTAEYRFARGDGRWAYICDRALVVHDDAGLPVRIVGAMQDVTEREELQGQLRQAHRMEAVGRLAGGVAHDFNNLLTVIGASVTFARGELPPDSPALRDLDEIADASRRASSLTRQLLAFSRKQLLQPRRLDVSEMVAGLEGMLRRLIGEDLVVQTALAPSLWPVFADHGQLEQVVVNLVVNARDAMPHGGTVRIATRAVVVDEQIARGHRGLVPGEYVALAVEDAGVGIEADALPHIFEPFFTTKEPGQGTGLGLAMVYGTVKQSGGHVLVDTTPGRGTTVTVLLPHDPDFTPTPSTPRAPRPSHGHERVLLVEDEGAVRAVLRRMLTGNGYEVLEAADGVEALDLWATQRQRGLPVDLVLTDAVMPVLGGRALIARLHAESPDVKIVLMSGYTPDTAGTQAALALGETAAFLQKPIERDELLLTLRRVLDSDGTTGDGGPDGNRDDAATLLSTTASADG